MRQTAAPSMSITRFTFLSKLDIPSAMYCVSYLVISLLMFFSTIETLTFP